MEKKDILNELSKLAKNMEFIIDNWNHSNSQINKNLVLDEHNTLENFISKLSSEC